MSPDISIRDLYFHTITGWTREKFDPAKFFERAKSVQRAKIIVSPSAAAAFSVSKVLKAYRLVSHTHVSINDLVRDMRKNGWVTINELVQGAVLVWTAVDKERHVGFFSDSEHAISFDPYFHKPYKHHITFGIKDDSKGKPQPVRKVKYILWHPRLER